MEPVKPGEWRGEGSMFHHGDTDDEEESFEKGKMSNSEVKKYVDSVICQRCLTECPSRGGSEGGQHKMGGWREPERYYNGEGMCLALGFLNLFSGVPYCPLSMARNNS